MREVVTLLVLLSMAPVVLRAQHSALLPCQIRMSDFEDVTNIHIRLTGREASPFPPSHFPPRAIHSPVVPSPPAYVPIYPPAPLSRKDRNRAAPVPPTNAFRDAPNPRGKQQPRPASCKPRTVVVTSRDVVVSTRVSVSQVLVTSTVVRQVTVTRRQPGTSVRTSYVTVQGPVQTLVRTVTSKPPRSTTTRIYTQTVTSTEIKTQIQTRTVTRERVRSTTVVSTTARIYTKTVTSTSIQTKIQTQLRTVTRTVGPHTVYSTKTRKYTQTVTSTSVQAKVQIKTVTRGGVRPVTVFSTTTRVYTQTVTSTLIQTRTQPKIRTLPTVRTRPRTVFSTTTRVYTHTLTTTITQARCQKVTSCTKTQYVTVTRTLSRSSLPNTVSRQYRLTSTHTHYVTTTATPSQGSTKPAPVECRVVWGCPCHHDHGSVRRTFGN
ncbi:uncharacterized protein [Panulirus ornatus]|uniref:uncharacterized protein isoform X1 n=1 Tax=Panulirus ornatus TaxID=150431 RepID=UPI003A86A896